jgi:hypothetical protein
MQPLLHLAQGDEGLGSDQIEQEIGLSIELGAFGLPLTARRSLTLIPRPPHPDNGGCHAHSKMRRRLPC